MRRRAGRAAILGMQQTIRRYRGLHIPCGSCKSMVITVVTVLAACIASEQQQQQQQQ